jgi:hypothetical protein
VLRLPDWTRRGSSTRRAILLVGSSAILLITVLITIKYSEQVVMHPKRSVTEADRLAKVSDIVTLGTLVLTLIAGIVAVLAYAAATGQPKLQVRVEFTEQPFNEIFFEWHRLERDGKSRMYASMEASKIIAHIWVRNLKGYSARNPAIIVRLRSMARDKGMATASPGWEVIEFETSGDILDMQWDGGTQYSIHGDSIRRLPDLSLAGLYYGLVQSKPVILFELLAEGYRRSVEIPVILSESKRAGHHKEWM